MRSSAEPAAAWVGLAALLAVGACLSFLVDPHRVDWEPALAWREPWRAWTAAFVHLSALHLVANLAGTAAVAALGWMARVSRRSVVAWAVAWPATQFGLLVRPDLLHYGGLSGLLHAGVAVVALGLVVGGRGVRRLVGAATLAVLLAKVMAEAPWGAVLRQVPGWDIAIAPVAHASGLAAGLLAGALVELLARRRGMPAGPA